MENKEILKKIKAKVKRNDNMKLYDNHISVALDYALKLCGEEDKEDMTIAVLLHDIGRMKFGGDRHNITGAKETELFLKSIDFDEERMDRIIEAIMSHGGEIEFPIKDKFGEILRCADGLSHLDIFPLFLSFRLKKHDGDLKKSIIKLKEKYEKEWEDKITLPEAKNLGRRKYESIMLLLNSNLKVIEDGEKYERK